MCMCARYVFVCARAHSHVGGKNEVCVCICVRACMCACVRIFLYTYGGGEERGICECVHVYAFIHMGVHKECGASVLVHPKTNSGTYAYTDMHNTCIHVYKTYV